VSRSAWLRGIDPPVPEPFLSRLAPVLEEGAIPGSPSDSPDPTRPFPDPELLMDAAMASLGRALAPEGRERGGAFDLLAADAFATWAAEAGLAKEDPEAWLLEMTRRFARGPRGR
jgi:hypothetical protein